MRLNTKDSVKTNKIILQNIEVQIISVSDQFWEIVREKESHDNLLYYILSCGLLIKPVCTPPIENDRMDIFHQILDLESGYLGSTYTGSGFKANITAQD